MNLKMKCTNMQNKAETTFNFYPKIEVITLASTNAFAISGKKFINEYNRRIEAGEQIQKFSIFDEFDNEFIFETI